MGLGEGGRKRAAALWYLVGSPSHKNLGDAVEDFLIRARLRLPDAPATEPSLEGPLTSFSATKASQGKSQARLLRKWKLYQHVQELHRQGMSLRAIADHLSLARNTVRKYFRQPPEPPLPTPRPLRASQMDPFEDSILKRWSQGCRNAALMRDIRSSLLETSKESSG